MTASALAELWRLLRRPPLPLKTALFLLAALVYGATGYFYFEWPAKPELAWMDGFWWSMVTMTTVGYGDHFPATTGGRFLIAYPLMLIGMGFMGFALAQLASFVLRADLLNRKGYMMSTFRNQIVVCNYSSLARFSQLLRELRSQVELKKEPVVLIDQDLDALPVELASQEVHFIMGHPARSETLRRANLDAANRAVVQAKDPGAASSDDATTTICLALKKLRPELHVVAECVDPDNQEAMARSGCDSIVCVMNLGPGILAQELHDPGVVQVLEELTIWDGHINNVFIVPVAAGERSTVADLRAWTDRHSITLLGVRNSGQIILNPPADRLLAAGDAAVVITPTRPKEIGLS